MLSLQIGTKKITTERPSFVMGICNATSDSFYKKSRGGIKKAFELIDQGADIIDIGAESTRPGLSEISSEEQIRKIIPIIKAIRKKSDIPISVDTRSSVVMNAAINEGADILNDVSSLSSDTKMIDILQNNEISVILMHGFMQKEDKKSSVDIVKEVSDFFYKKIEFLKENDIDLSKVILDPGIGFGKTFEVATKNT
jgi:dihydropteroate synthase